MKTAAFEEKEYEGPLYNQLEAGCPFLWSPGQAFENHIGIDRAMMVNNPRFWTLLGRVAPRGAVMNRYNWDYLFANRPRRELPNFRLNLFIQAKRPKHFNKAPRHIRTAGMNGPGWCFELDVNQQTALERVAARLGNKAAIVYAAPVFHSLFHLYRHTTQGTVIEHSTFPDVSRLQNHRKWFYDTPGGDGIPNPDAKFSNGPSLFIRIERMREEESGNGNENAAQELSFLSKMVVESLRQDGLQNNPRVALLFQEVRNIARETSFYGQIGEQVRDLLQVAAFAQSFNVEWVTIA